MADDMMRLAREAWNFGEVGALARRVSRLMGCNHPRNPALWPLNFLRPFMVLSGLTLQRALTRAVFAFSFVLPIAFLRAQPAGLTGTMPEDVLPELNAILRTALQQSPQVILAAIDVERGEAARIQANAARWPSLNGNATFANNQEAVSSNTSTQSRASGLFYSINLNQSIFHWGALKNQSAVGKIGLLIAEKNYAEAYRSLSVVLRQSYLELVIKKARLKHARYQFARAQDDLALLKEDTTRVSPAAVAGRELDLRDARLKLDRTETDFAAGLRRFARIGGLGEFTEDNVADELPKPAYLPALAQSITAKVLRDRGADAYEPQVLALRVREAELRYKIESVRLLPKVNAGASYSLDNSSTVGTNRVVQEAIQRQRVDVSAQWNFFDGFATRAAKMEANAVRRLYASKLSSTVEALLDQVQGLERNLKFDAEEIEISEVRYGIAHEAKKRIVEESALGQLAKAEVDRADGSILLNRAEAFVARAKFFADWSELVSIAGFDPVLQNLPSRYVREKR